MLQASTPTSLNAFAVQSLRKPRLLATVVDILLVLVGTASSVAVCIDFMNWLGRPLDSAALMAMAFLVACIWSICWSMRYLLRETVLRPSAGGGKPRKPHEQEHA
jgi:hypothetical protein